MIVSSKEASGIGSGTPGRGSRRLLETISPAGFERYFEEMVDLLEKSSGPPDPRELGAIAARHGKERTATASPA
jgi:hypothetical protein